MFNKNIAIPEEYVITLPKITSKMSSDPALNEIYSQMVIKEKKNIIHYLYNKNIPDKLIFENLFYRVGKYIAGAAIAISITHIICDSLDIGSVSSSINLNHKGYMISFLEDMNIYNKDLYNTIYDTEIAATDIVFLSPVIPIIGKGIGLIIDKSLSKIYDTVKKETRV